MDAVSELVEPRLLDARVHRGLASVGAQTGIRQEVQRFQTVRVSDGRVAFRRPGARASSRHRWQSVERAKARRARARHQVVFRVCFNGDHQGKEVVRT